MAKATDTITDSEDIVKLAKPGDYYQVRTHHMFSRILNFLFLFVKFMFSKKATKIDKIFTVDLTLTPSPRVTRIHVTRFPLAR